MILINNLLTQKSWNPAALKTQGTALLQRARADGNARLVLFVIGAIALVSLLGFIYLKSQGVDYRQQSEVLGYLRELKEIDARWDLEVLRARVEGASGKAPAVGDRWRLAGSGRRPRHARPRPVAPPENRSR
jgi:hypothetical protein